MSFVRFDPENPYSRRTSQYESWKKKKRSVADPEHREVMDQDKECPLRDFFDDYDDDETRA